jgi:hypothetical protein
MSDVEEKINTLFKGLEDVHKQLLLILEVMKVMTNRLIDVEQKVKDD